MKEESLNEFKKMLESKRQKAIDYNSMVEEIRELQKNELILKYLQLINQNPIDISFRKTTDESLIWSALNSFSFDSIDEKDTNHIFAYMGSWAVNKEMENYYGKDEGNYPVDYDDPNTVFRIYHDIEQRYYVKVLMEDCMEFEKKKIIINKHKIVYDGYAFNDIQKDFFLEAIKTNQEEAKKLVLKKYSEFKGN